jgi:hypothetical protein
MNGARSACGRLPDLHKPLLLRGPLRLLFGSGRVCRTADAGISVNKSIHGFLDRTFYPLYFLFSAVCKCDVFLRNADEHADVLNLAINHRTLR